MGDQLAKKRAFESDDRNVKAKADPQNEGFSLAVTSSITQETAFSVGSFEQKTSTRTTLVRQKPTPKRRPKLSLPRTNLPSLGPINPVPQHAADAAMDTPPPPPLGSPIAPLPFAFSATTENSFTFGQSALAMRTTSATTFAFTGNFAGITSPGTELANMLGDMQLDTASGAVPSGNPKPFF